MKYLVKPGYSYTQIIRTKPPRVVEVNYHRCWAFGLRVWWCGFCVRIGATGLRFEWLWSQERIPKRMLSLGLKRSYRRKADWPK